MGGTFASNWNGQSMILCVIESSSSPTSDQGVNRAVAMKGTLARVKLTDETMTV